MASSHCQSSTKTSGGKWCPPEEDGAEHLSHPVSCHSCPPETRQAYNEDFLFLTVSGIGQACNAISTLKEIRKKRNICEGKFLHKVTDVIPKGFSEKHFKF